MAAFFSNQDLGDRHGPPKRAGSKVDVDGFYWIV